MKLSITRTGVVVALLALVGLLTVSGVAQSVIRRGYVASTLIGTFFLFPLSSVNEMHVDQGTMAQLNALDHNDTARIPTLIHQVKLGGLDMRPAWKAARKSCVALHPTWTFMLWQDDDADAFVRTHYPSLFAMYRDYPYEIQRSNVLRYLLLDHYGGVYLDLDLRCRVALDGLRNETLITPPANPSGVNNAFIASTRGNPFWSHLIEQLPAYNMLWFGSPYITNMMSTGCHFFSTMHRTHAQQSSLKVLDQANKLNGHVTTPLFEHLGASSWHRGDAKAILRLGKAVEQLKQHSALTGAIAALTLVSVVVLLVFRRRRLRSNATDEEVALKKALL